MPSVFLASLYTNKTQHWGRRLVSEVYPDRTFEVLPISQDSDEHHADDKTYDDIPSWHDPKKSLAKYLRFDESQAGLVVHDDPDLHTGFAFGDIYGAKAGRLFDAEPGDWLLVIANLAYASEPGHPDTRHSRTGWHFVGCLAIDEVDFAGAGDLHSKKYKWHQHARDAQVFGYDEYEGLWSVIVAGNPKRRDQRFSRAVPVLTAKDAGLLLRDKTGAPVDAAAYPTVMNAVGSYTRAIRPIANTKDAADRSYLKAIRSAILENNPSLRDLLW